MITQAKGDGGYNNSYGNIINNRQILNISCDYEQLWSVIRKVIIINIFYYVHVNIDGNNRKDDDDDYDNNALQKF